MAFNDIKRLSTAAQQVASAAAAIYTAPAGKRAQIGSIILHNTNVTPEIVSIYDNGTSSANRLVYIVLSSGETYELAPKVPIVLDGSETLQASTTTASKVNIKIYGREEA